jgi:starch phosphorylase
MLSRRKSEIFHIRFLFDKTRGIKVPVNNYFFQTLLMKSIHTFLTIPSLPAPLERLRELAYNLRWAWDHETILLFRRLDSELWEKTGHNPILMLGIIDQTKLEKAASDEGFMAHLDRVAHDLDIYQSSKSTWFSQNHGSIKEPLIAYFSAEFGVTECLSIFAGGLGVLAGDHLKSASDLGIPLIGVGLLYQQGYFRQYLNEAGWQQEVYEDNDFHNLPLILECQLDGKPLMIEVPYPGRQVFANVWRTQVGRVALYLLDTNIPENKRAEDRDITDQLYGGDLEMRIKQEIMLGIGGYRTLKALKINPTVYHMNEGHSAFLALEWIRWLLEADGLSYAEACEAASAGLVFTTHTPVTAGHDYFPPDLMDRYFADYMKKLGLSRKDFLALGRQNPDNESEPFCMTVLALRMASYTNGVSRLHGEVSRRMWRNLWPNVPERELPIVHVTNGIHFMSWISREMRELYDRYLGLHWQKEPADQEVWQQVEHIASEELWFTHQRRKERLVAFARRRLRSQLEQRGASKTTIKAADEVLQSGALTIGFARRFATYKRATLLLYDPQRLARILNNPDRPVQIIFAGKAHPKDNPGKELIQKIIGLARQEEFRRRIVFLEDYDMAVARYLVQGSDVWLNTPLRPREASGTSGMKAAANGVLNLSILDGWWDEAYQSSDVGWAIGKREAYEDRDYQDQVEAGNLYDILEQEVIPIFYDRGADGLPRRWIARMKATIGKLCYFFNTHRMVEEYTEQFYLPAAAQYRKLTANKLSGAKALAAWTKRVRANWSQLRIELVDAGPSQALRVGEKFYVRARVHLGSLTPEDVEVQLYLGRVNAAEEIVDAKIIPMKSVEVDREWVYIYEASEIACWTSGLHGYTIRILPKHLDLVKSFLPGLIVWA